MVASANNKVKIFESRILRARWSLRCLLRFAWERATWWRWRCRNSSRPSRLLATDRVLTQSWSGESIVAGWHEGFRLLKRDWGDIRFKKAGPHDVGFDLDPVRIRQIFELAPHVLSDRLSRKQQAQRINDLFNISEDMEGLAALMVIVESIPNEVIDCLAEIPSRRHSSDMFSVLRLIRLAADAGVSLDWVLERIRQAPLFWVAVAESPLVFHPGVEGPDAELIARVFRSKHHEIVHEILVLQPYAKVSKKVCRRTLRLLDKMPRKEWGWGTICKLCSTWKDASPQHRGWLAHATCLNSTAISLIDSDRTLGLHRSVNWSHLVTFELFCDVCENAGIDQSLLYNVVHQLSEIVYKEQQMGVPKSGPFTTLRAVQGRYWELYEIEHDRKRACILPSLDLARFEAPTPPGVEQVTSVRELLDEGQFQKNCVGGSVHEACKGEVFIFRVTEPQRATLRLSRHGGEWHWSPFELKAKANRDVSDKTRKIIDEWIRAINRKSSSDSVKGNSVQKQCES